MTSDLITDDPRAGRAIAASGRRTCIAVSAAEPQAVRRAALDLADDLRRVCGGDVRVVDRVGPDTTIVVGTVGISRLLTEPLADGRLELGDVRTADGAMRWEGFVVQLGSDGLLYVAGADRRGTVFGLYELSEAAGVSPWRWFADVPVRPREQVTVPTGARVADWPSVRYRGIFLNDEEQLDAWARAHTADGTIGPELYARVFELVLRLRGNYIWPAMHASAFNHDPENGRLADEMGIVVGTSHCDMLLRSNEHEWGPWAARQEESVSYDYSIRGRNREKLLDYWRESVEANGAYEVSWTLGMRGIHDYGFQTSAIDADDSLSADEKERARVALLQEVIDDQQALLEQTLGAEQAARGPRIFIPYKEVLPLYDAGLRVPDDVTIVWANDSFGYVRRFPDGAELQRSGGHGLYYHSSYWSQPPRSYLATSSTPLALMRHELRKSWDHGIRELWVDNVGSLKPLELETEFFLRLAWQVGKETTTSDVVSFMENWADRTFSGSLGARVARVLDTYYRVNNQRKLEHLSRDVFPLTGYGDEAGRRLQVLRELYDETNDLLRSLPGEERDAFIQLVALKVHMAYLVNAQFVHADRSVAAHERGGPAAADRHLEMSRAFEAQIRALIHSYNVVVAAGKWQDVFSPDTFPPPVMALHPVARPALTIGPPGLDVVAWGESGRCGGGRPQLEFWPHGTQSKWIDLFAVGTPGVAYRITSDDWLEASPAHGIVAAEQRVAVRLRNGHPGGGTGSLVVQDVSSGSTTTVDVVLHPWVDLGDSTSGAVEADGYVSLDAASPDASSTTGTSRWVVVPSLGRDGGSAVEARGGAGATLEFSVHLSTPGAHLMEIHRLPTLDATGRIRLATSVDEQPSVVVESFTSDEHRGDWTQTVLDNVDLLRLRLPNLDRGWHVLRLHAVDEHVTVSKVVVRTATETIPTNLGPVFSQHSGRYWVDTVDPDPAAVEVGSLVADARELYGVDPSDVPLRPVVSTGPMFWSSDTTFKVNAVREQLVLGAPLHQTRDDGTKDVLATLGSGVALERGGVLALETEWVLAQTDSAWSTPGTESPPTVWTHAQSETNGRTGLAMYVDAAGREFDDPVTAPSMNYAVDVGTTGTFHVWLLVRLTSHDDDACWLAVDGTVQHAHRQHSGGDLYTFGTQQIWFWSAFSDIELTAGRHTISVIARKAGLLIDRLYLTTGDELPPLDADWRTSDRRSPSLLAFAATDASASASASRPIGT